ncbi:MAG: hypothetical protein LW629_07860 [Burkholderiales bacterium]|nr:hypothetical protein [Burkholderiales bacterium]
MFAIWVVDDQFNAGFLNVLSEGVLAPLTGLEQWPPIKSFSWPEPLPNQAWGELLSEIQSLSWDADGAWWRFFVINPSQGPRIVLLQSRVLFDVPAFCRLAGLLGSSDSLTLPLGLQSDNPVAGAFESRLKQVLLAQPDPEETVQENLSHVLPASFVFTELEAVADLFSVSPTALLCMVLQVAFHRLLGSQTEPLCVTVKFENSSFELDSHQVNPLRWWLLQEMHCKQAVNSFQPPASDPGFLCCGEVLQFAVTAPYAVPCDPASVTLTLLQIGPDLNLALSGGDVLGSMLNALGVELQDAFEQLLFAAFSIAGMGRLDEARMLGLMDEGLPAMEGLMDNLIAKQYAPGMQSKAQALAEQLEALNQRLADQSSVDKNA